MGNEMNIDKFLEIEEKYKLNEKEILGIHYWTLFRMDFWNYTICSEKLGLSEPHNKAGIGIADCFEIIKNYLWPISKIKGYDILVLNHARRVKSGDQYECIYTDSWIRGKYHAIYLEEPFHYKHLTPVASEKVIYNDRIIINSKLLALFVKKICFKIYKRFLSQVHKDVNSALQELRQEYCYEIDDYEIESKLVELCIRAKYEKKRYKKIIERINPKLIIEVVSYERRCMIINGIAKELRIPTYELQHGTMYREHAAYHYSEKNGISYFPDYLFLFSDFWKKMISVPIPSENQIVVGYPYFENKKQRYINYKRTDLRKTIIFLSQGTIGKYLADLAVGISESLSSNDYRIIYKLHPSEYDTWRDELPSLVNDKIEVIDNRAMDLYELFATSDYQVGAYSTALFEGLGFALKTFVYEVGHYDMMLPLVEQGYANLVTDANDLVRRLTSNDDFCKNNNTINFWKEDAVKNIYRIIDKKMDGAKGNI